MNRDRLHQIIDHFRRRRVVVLGDLLVDEFVHGDIVRVSREAPVLILNHTRTVVVPGGGGNAVANLRALDAVPVPVGRVGRDDSGRRLLAAFRKDRIPVTGIVVDPEWETPTKSRVLAGGIHTRRQQIVRIDRGARTSEEVPPTPSGLSGKLRQALGKAEGLLVADYGYGAASPALVKRYGPGVIRKGVPVTVDSRTRSRHFGGMTACTPNQEELEQAAGVELTEDDQAVTAAGRTVLKRTGHQAVLVTRGAAGMSLLEKGRPGFRIPAYGGDEVADVTGAGDTVIAVFTLALAAGGSFQEAAVLANYAAGLVVMKAGTATLGREELHGAVDGDPDR
jgi:rfaE bifunctional protein kinase chain/domain